MCEAWNLCSSSRAVLPKSEDDCCCGKLFPSSSPGFHSRIAAPSLLSRRVQSTALWFTHRQAHETAFDPADGFPADAMLRSQGERLLKPIASRSSCKRLGRCSGFGDVVPMFVSMPAFSRLWQRHLDLWSGFGVKVLFQIFLGDHGLHAFSNPKSPKCFSFAVAKWVTP